MGTTFRVLVDRVVAEAPAGGAHPRVVQLGGNLREGFVLAVNHVHLCRAILLHVIAVSGGTDYAVRQDSFLRQQFGRITTGQIVHGSLIVEEGFPFARNEQVAQCALRNSLMRVFR